MGLSRTSVFGDRYVRSFTEGCCPAAGRLLALFSAVVELGLVDAALEGQIGLPGQARLEVCEDALGGLGVVPEHVHGHQRELLGVLDIGQLGVDDLVIGAVATAGGAADIRVQRRHDVGNVAHVGGAAAV